MWARNFITALGDKSPVFQCLSCDQRSSRDSSYTSKWAHHSTFFNPFKLLWKYEKILHDNKRCGRIARTESTGFLPPNFGAQKQNISLTLPYFTILTHRSHDFLTHLYYDDVVNALECLARPWYGLRSVSAANSVEMFSKHRRQNSRWRIFTTGYAIIDYK